MYDKYMASWEKVSNIMKKNFNEPIYKKYLNAKKRLKTKESFQYFCIPVRLFDSLYLKYGNNYPEVCLEKFIHNCFWKNIRNSLILEYKKFSMGRFFKIFSSLGYKVQFHEI